MNRAAKIRIIIRPATDDEVAWARPGAAADGVNMEPSDAARPTTWWIAVTPRGNRLGICGMMPVEDGGQRLRGAWVVPAWRGLGVWWTMVQYRVAEAYDRGAEWVETYAVHPGPLLRNGWKVASTKDRNGAVHLSRRLVEPAHLSTCGYLGNETWSCSLECPALRVAASTAIYTAHTSGSTAATEGSERCPTQ
jgi:GNAT superfamily N-acetyltransferase